MSVSTIFLVSCVCAGVLALTCAVIIWAVKNILEWADDIFDDIDELKYTLNKHKRNREDKN